MSTELGTQGLGEPAGLAQEGPGAGGWADPRTGGVQLVSVLETARPRLGVYREKKNHAIIQQIILDAYCLPGSLPGSGDAELNEQGTSWRFTRSSA